MIRFAKNASMSILVCVTLSCNDEIKLSTAANDFFHIEVDGAYLPVMVRGNTKSGTILLFVQGGPGYPSIDFALIDYPKWKNTIEQDFAIAYYDQRGLGNKQGRHDLNTITLAQYQRDLLHMVRFLRSRYTGAKVILFGHSWGGDLSYHFLINHTNAEVDALISVCGPPTHDGENVAQLRWRFRREYLLNVADIFISKGVDNTFWFEARDWALNTNPISTDEEQLRWNKYVMKAERFTEGTVKPIDYLKIGFASPYNIFQDLQYSYNDAVASALIRDEVKTNILNDFDKITIPVLIIGSRFDDQAPLEELQYVFDHVGSRQKNFVAFPEAGHNAFLDDPEGFRNTVRNFCTSLP